MTQLALRRGRASKTTNKNPPGAGFRPDIQGLRAVAVVLVVLDHLFGWPQGGFIGVDVFFVISGFLITGLLLREGDRSGRVSIGNFYRRRARRILPVSLVVVGATVTASYVLFLAGRFHDVVVDAWWTVGFLVNWHLASVGTDYFQSDSPPSPLQHYWSLAVEEQFYVVWPILIAGLLLVAHRWRKGLSLRPFVAGFAVVVIACSFAWAMYQSAEAPTVAYFSTFTRAWELGAGALIATGTALLTRLNAPTRNVMGAVGLVGIVLSAFVIDAASTFPAPIGALPIVATCLVIAAGVGVRDVGAHWLLTVRPAVYIGTVSYSLYLWHWPVIVLLESVMDKTRLFYTIALLLMVVLTVASYHLIEKPVLDSTFLLAAKRDAGAVRRTGRRPGRDAQLVLVSGLAIAVVFLLVAGFNRPAPVFVNDGPAPVLAPIVVAGQEDPLEIAIRGALDTTQFPPLTPPLDDIERGTPSEMRPDAQCIDAPSISLDQCNYGDPTAPQSAFVVGDSVSVAWMPAVRGVLEPAGYRVHGVALSNCPFVDADIDIEEDPEQSDQCNTSHDTIADQINETRPNLVVISDMEYGIQRLVTDAGSRSAWTDARTKMIERLRPSGARIVILAPDPTGLAATDCATRVAVPADCVNDVSDNWKAKRNADEIAATSTGATFVDTRPWFCYGNTCPIFVSGILVRYDTQHLTVDYAQYLIPRVRAVLLP